MSSAVVTYSSPDVAERVLASSESVLGCDDVQLMPLWADENDEPAGITEALLHSLNNTLTHTTVKRPFFRDYPGEPVPER